MVKSMRNGKFRPPTAPKRLTDIDEIRILEPPPKTTHHATFHLDTTTWVVSANTQFATVHQVSFFVFLVSSSRAHDRRLKLFLFPFRRGFMLKLNYFKEFDTRAATSIRHP